MKTITLNKEQFDKATDFNNQILQEVENGKYDDDLYTLGKDLDRSHNNIVKVQEVETRAYVLEISDSEVSETSISDEEFQTLAEQQGRVYTLQGFQEAFNLEEINSAIDVIRFISVPFFNLFCGKL